MTSRFYFVKAESLSVHVIFVLFFQGKLLLEQNKLELASFHVRFVFVVYFTFL